MNTQAPLFFVLFFVNRDSLHSAPRTISYYRWQRYGRIVWYWRYQWEKRGKIGSLQQGSKTSDTGELDKDNEFEVCRGTVEPRDPILKRRGFESWPRSEGRLGIHSG